MIGRPRVVFLGSPDAAVPSLRAAREVAHVVAVLSQPDRPAGRGRRVASPPVAVAARELGIPVHQPDRIRTTEARALLESLRPDVALVVAYGRILPPSLLAVPPRGCVNVHFSLLPRHRGAAPVAHTLLAGDPAAGVTLMLLDEGLDTGPLLAQRTVDVGPEETAGELTDRLATLGAEMVVAELPRWTAGEIEPRPQPAAGATLAPPLAKADGAVVWDAPAAEVHRRIRAVTPRPGAHGYLGGRRVILHRVRLLPHVASPGPGVLRVEGRRLAVGAADACVEILELQREGGRRTGTASFLAGFAPPPGAAIRPGPEGGASG